MLLELGNGAQKLNDHAGNHHDERDDDADLH